MSKLINIRAYEYQELSDKAKDVFKHYMYDSPFESETGELNDNGEMIIEYDYFAEWYLEEQIEFCKMNNYLFSKYGKLIGHLEEVNQ